MRRAEEALRILVDLTRALTERVVDLDDALQAVTDAALELFEGQHASLRILDESGSELLTGARSGEGAGMAPMRFRRGEGVAGWVIEHGALARVDDTAADPRFVRYADQGYEIGSLLAIPLFSAGRVIGCLTITSAAPRHFSPDDEVLSRLLANCAVPPLERARLQRIAITDALTGALNRSQLEPVLARAMEIARELQEPLALLSMDLDHFKRVNDEHGHAAGDAVLRVFAQRVRRLVRRRDVFIRRGGEEFVLVLPDCDLEVARAAAERVRHSMADNPIRLDDHHGPDGGPLLVDQRVSVGVALWRPDETPSELDRRADEALYAAKRKGRDRIEVAPVPEP
ncbi:MAG TPA: sensor domain-containing diguanylate cyclase [Polyangiaceae bacterium LLY-WYZ-15_(1-7)]|nr:sensor domain-containing diguanylate cyclase [Polyangiaceae bacterium LLY-WYZ-15_(1-7)]HJL05072.1 sensor domain-containing diguanylate cyclase [Polyangiaceae bacterium LLY-WYZ-15_(1-7)]HJL07868.1 sensor domain-containing diguanylate cyclase [Polyangiaceae bacterium LLY-WYZ-15_(1-7)]HJL24783.1 sensor domain-containing diguanylate cyclase [Polyangiaceae bacterium LLY-WYZ-15_(1-7)]HJL31332.1 sensor domain-containing diguanylate cyclase [Polyangiaceae bacterium LLY-WYZ-15_(1-7)]